METIMCEICYENKEEFEFVNLHCNHRFCRSCFQKAFDFKANPDSAYQSNPVCPKESCKQPINFAILKENVTKECFEIYENMKKMQLSEENVAKSITNKEFNNEGNFIPFTAVKKINEFELFIEKMGWKRCPICNCVVEKIGGACQYICCESAKCSKKTIFCYVCGERIKNVSTHFIKNKCVKVQIKEKNIEEPSSELKKESEKKDYSNEIKEKNIEEPSSELKKESEKNYSNDNEEEKLNEEKLVEKSIDEKIIKDLQIEENKSEIKPIEEKIIEEKPREANQLLDSYEAGNVNSEFGRRRENKFNHNPNTEVLCPPYCKLI